MIRRSIALVALLGVMAPEPVPADEIKRRALADFSISSSVEVPGGRTLVFLSGTVPDVADPDAAPGTTERYGDTATQAASVLTKLERELQALGMTMANVVKMNVFMVGDPRKGGVMDFDGLMAAYGKHFGTATQKNLPARTTVQVAGLPLRGALVEIELVAAR
jgi:enamine deaminase RidA (YjgF/YER057c/UK114 family)